MLRNRHGFLARIRNARHVPRSRQRAEADESHYRLSSPQTRNVRAAVVGSVPGAYRRARSRIVTMPPPSHAETLDPDDWEAMRRLAHRAVDDGFDHLARV